MGSEFRVADNIFQKCIFWQSDTNWRFAVETVSLCVHSVITVDDCCSELNWRIWGLSCCIKSLCNWLRSAQAKPQEQSMQTVSECMSDSLENKSLTIVDGNSRCCVLGARQIFLSVVIQPCGRATPSAYLNNSETICRSRFFLWQSTILLFTDTRLLNIIIYCCRKVHVLIRTKWNLLTSAKRVLTLMCEN